MATSVMDPRPSYGMSILGSEKTELKKINHMEGVEMCDPPPLTPRDRLLCVHLSLIVGLHKPIP